MQNPAPSLATARRIVVKIGSALVVDEAEAAPRARWLASVAADVTGLRDDSSGAVRELFGALGLRRDAIVHADAPFRIDTILVTEPAFRPQAQGYPDFVRFCRQLGARLMEAAPPPPRLDRPVYLTKSGLAAGVARWQNEAELEAALQRRGFAIIHPQDLTLAEHLRLYASGATIYGVIGSAHHVSLFAPAPVRFKLLAPERLNANFFLIDDLTGNDSTYHFAQGTHNVPNTGAPFIVERVIPEPEQVADALCAAL